MNLVAFRHILAQVLSASVKQKRLDRLKKNWSDKIKTLFFTDEKNFDLNPPVNNQNYGVWASGRKSDIAAKRLSVECKKFANHVQVSVGVCFGCKGKLHFVAEKVEVRAKLVENLLLHLINDCKKLLLDHFNFSARWGSGAQS